MRLMLGAAIAAILLVGGCRQSDEGVKAKLRADIMQRCTTNIAPEVVKQAGFDGQKYCTCITDKAVGTQSVAELKKLFEDKAATAAQGRQAATECLAQQTPDGAPAPAAPAPAGAPAAAPATPPPPAAETNEAGAEAEEETSEDTAEGGAEDSQ
jgi:hypothetical protein